MTPKETQPARGTHELLSGTEGGTDQDTKRNQACKGCSRPIKSRRYKSRHQGKPSEPGTLTSCPVQREGQPDKLGNRNKLSEQGALTNCRAQREGQVRTPIKTERLRDTHELRSVEGVSNQDTERNRVARGTHGLSSIEGETSEDTKINEASKSHSHSVKRRGRDNQDTKRN